MTTNADAATADGIGSGVEALAGVRVLDTTSLLPGPFAAQVLADLGATVVKVERPGGDPMRHIGQGAFAAMNHGKWSIELDLKNDGDRETFLGLVADADVLLENGRPDAMERLGLGYDVLAGRNPRLVYASLSGWGRSGPAAGEPGHNVNYLARAGATYLTGPRGGPPSDAVPFVTADLAGALYTVIAVLAALRDRPRTGRRLDISLYASTLALLAPRFAEYVAKGRPSRDDLLRRPAHGVFEAGDGLFLTIAAVEDHFWEKLCRALGLEDFGARADLATYVQRFDHADEVDELLEATFRRRPRDAWVRHLREHDVPVAPVLAPEDVPSDPQARHLDIYQSWPDVRTFLPVTGLRHGAAGDVADVDEHGGRLRAAGWPVHPLDPTEDP